MYAIPAQHRCGPSRYPNPGESIRVHFILLNESLSLFMYVYAAVLPVVYLIVPYYWITVCTYLLGKKKH